MKLFAALWSFIAGAALPGVALLVISGIVYLWPAASALLQGDFFLLVVFQASVFMLLYLIWMRIPGVRVWDFGAIPGLKILIPGFIGLLVLNAMASFALSKLDPGYQQYEFLDKSALRARQWHFFIAVVVLAPLYEELVFRGLILPTFSGAKPGVFRGLLSHFFSAFLFAVLHYEAGKSFLTILPFLAIGLYLGAMASRQSSVTLPLILHSLQNLVAGAGYLYGSE